MDEEHDTLLMKATNYGSKKIISNLLKLKANPFIGDEYGNTAFSIALKNGADVIVKEFIKAKAEQDNKNKQDILELIEKLGSTVEELEQFFALNICQKETNIRDLLGLNNHQAITCFSEAENYCYENLGDAIDLDLSNANELV